MKTISLFFFIAVLASSAYCQDLEQLKSAKPFDINGGLSVQNTLYGASGIPARQPAEAYIISGSPTVSIYGFQVPFSFIYSNTQKDFRQPFNQFGLSPQYKWLKLHFGYRNLTFSQFGLAGHLILGEGIELTPGKFRFAAVYGQTQKAVQEDTTKTISNDLNSVNYPAYKQMLGAVKIGYGTESNFFDLYGLQGQDDVNSLPYKPMTASVLPAKNQVLGATYKVSLFKQRLMWTGEAAGSIYTRDITAPSINLGSTDYGNIVQNILTPNLSTQVYAAAQSQIKYINPLFTVGVLFKRIDPDYQSMGAYYFQTDIAQYTGNFSTRLFKNKLNLNLSAGIQTDNVAKKKVATTERDIYSAAANYQLNQAFGIDLNYSNYGTSQKPGTKNLSDTTRIDQISNSWSLAPHYIFQQTKFTHTFFFILGDQQLNDNNKFTSDMTQVNMLFSNLNYSLINTTTKVNFNSGINYSKSVTQVGAIELRGLTFGVGRTIYQDKINLNLNINGNLSQFNQTSNGTVVNLTGSGVYTMNKHHSLRSNIIWLLNDSKNSAAGNSFNEFTFTVQYMLTF